MIAIFGWWSLAAASSTPTGALPRRMNTAAMWLSAAESAWKRFPEKARDLALQVARACCWDDVGIDICEHNGRFYVLEANMKYGKEGFREAGP